MTEHNSTDNYRVTNIYTVKQLNSQTSNSTSHRSSTSSSPQLLLSTIRIKAEFLTNNRGQSRRLDYWKRNNQELNSGNTRNLPPPDLSRYKPQLSVALLFHCPLSAPRDPPIESSNWSLPQRGIQTVRTISMSGTGFGIIFVILWSLLHRLQQVV